MLGFSTNTMSFSLREKFREKIRGLLSSKKSRAGHEKYMDSFWEKRESYHKFPNRFNSKIFNTLKTTENLPDGSIKILRNKGDCVPNLIKIVKDGLKKEKEEAYIVDGFNWLLVMACKKNKEAVIPIITKRIKTITYKGIMLPTLLTNMALVKQAPPFWESFIVKNIVYIDPKGIKKMARTDLLRWYFIRLGKEKYNNLFYREYMKVGKDFNRTIIIYKLIRSENPAFDNLILKILKTENKKVKNDLKDWLKNNKYVS